MKKPVAVRLAFAFDMAGSLANDESIELCSHISIRGVLVNEDTDACEYIETLRIRCSECNDEMTVNVWVN